MRAYQIRQDTWIPDVVSGLCECIQDILFPGHCSVCHCPVSLEDHHLCKSCVELFEKNNSNRCEVCGNEIEASLCSYCNERFFYPEKHFSPFLYSGRVKSAIHSMKFHGKRDILFHFIHEVLNSIEEIIDDIDAITCVPMTGKKLRDRGYNQAAFMGELLSGKLGIPFIGFLREKKGRGRQHDLSLEERLFNVIDRYEIINDICISGRKLLLVDDVFTTGATINESARVLVDGGAEKVFSATIAQCGLKKLDNF